MDLQKIYLLHFLVEQYSRATQQHPRVVE